MSRGFWVSSVLALMGLLALPISGFGASLSDIQSQLSTKQLRAVAVSAGVAGP